MLDEQGALFYNRKKKEKQILSCFLLLFHQIEKGPATFFMPGFPQNGSG